MSSCMKHALLRLKWQPAMQQVRHRNVNIQKPFPPHFTRAKVEHICKPITKPSKRFDPNIHPQDICNAGVKYFDKGTMENPYVTILANDLLNWFNHSKIIALFHLNPMASEERYELRLSLKKLEMRMKLYGIEVMTKTVTNTKYEPLLVFYGSETAVAFGPECNVKGLLKCLKKLPKVILLGAVVEDRLMSRAELDYYASIPDLQTAQAGLVAVLNSVGQTLVRQMNQHQSTLVQHLQTHVDVKSKEEPS